MSQTVVYCDFDGTITEKDNIISIMNKYAPNGWERIKNQILSREISIRDGVGTLFSLVPSSMRDEIRKFALENLRIRKGFDKFVAFTRESNIPLYVVSGGIDFFVLPAIEEYGPFDGIFCNASDFSGETIRILWPNACDSLCENDCGCCKPSIIRKLGHSDSFQIVIGDSVTDFEAAKQADFVLATGLLKEKCEQWKIDHDGFENFYDCIDSIKNRIEVKEKTC